MRSDIATERKGIVKLRAPIYFAWIMKPGCDDNARDFPIAMGADVFVCDDGAPDSSTMLSLMM